MYVKNASKKHKTQKYMQKFQLLYFK
ncbi:TPA: hypothetical protein O0155_002920, partial [Staphylococcus aureus]|nr:hypothetical protein [Staphylococcus aureus]